MRPENLIISEQGNGNPGEIILEVTAFENMGNEQLIYFSLNNQTVIARRSAQDPVEIGVRFFVRFQENSIIYIDPGSGEVYNSA
ncbi:MAG: TOBE domain-containing protein [Ginsengibacter sp.]